MCSIFTHIHAHAWSACAVMIDHTSPCMVGHSQEVLKYHIYKKSFLFISAIGSHLSALGEVIQTAFGVASMHHRVRSSEPSPWPHSFSSPLYLEKIEIRQGQIPKGPIQYTQKLSPSQEQQSSEWPHLPVLHSVRFDQDIF